MSLSRSLQRLTPALAICALVSGTADATMRLGVNTHFEQGWPPKVLDRVVESGAQGIRDSISWGKIEKSPGQYDFDARNSGYLDVICKSSTPVLLMVPMRNRVYDGGGPLTSPGAQAAYGRFVRAVVDRFPCVHAIEVGNEINAISRKFKERPDKADLYVDLLRQVRGALDGGRRRVALVGGSSLMVATGFLGKLIDAGMLPLVDAVAVHPYADRPEVLPAQIARLRAAMARAGGVKPIWATEFGLYYKTPEAAPPHGYKMMAILSAAGIAQADWYALLDEPWYPNMGLFAGGNPKPALQMFRRTARDLLTGGDAVRVDAGDPLTFIYRFGNGASVMWASARPIRFAGGAVIHDAWGHLISSPTMLGPDPIIVDAGARYELGPIGVLADTLYDAGSNPWQAAVETRSGSHKPLSWIDTNWASYLGVPGMPNVILSNTLVAVEGRSRKPVMLVETLRSPISGALWVSICLARTKAPLPTVTVSLNGRRLSGNDGTADGSLPVTRLSVAAGDRIAISYATQGNGAARILRRVRILAVAEQGAALCPAPQSGTQ